MASTAIHQNAAPSAFADLTGSPYSNTALASALGYVYRAVIDSSGNVVGTATNTYGSTFTISWAGAGDLRIIADSGTPFAGATYVAAFSQDTSVPYIATPFLGSTTTARAYFWDLLSNLVTPSEVQIIVVTYP